MRSDVKLAMAAGLIIVVIALVDWRVELDVAFGFLYVFPLILLGRVLPRWQIALVAALCTALADLFDPYPFVASVSVPHDILVFTSLAGTGLFAHAVTRSQRLARDAEEQFAFLVQTNPAAILTMTDEGQILLSNAAAHRLFRAPEGTLPGRNIVRYVPMLARVPSRRTGAVSATRDGATTTVKSAMQCRGERETGEGFWADVFFATYQTAAGPRMAAVIIDISEAVRERELTGLDQLLAGSRILVGAMFHEVRNVCSAMAINFETLTRSPQLAGNKNAEALGALIGTLSQLAATEAKSAKESDAAAVDVADVINDLRLVLDSYAEEAGIAMRWDVPVGLQPVWADRHRLLQVLLNLVRNSERALADRDVKRIDVDVSMVDDRVLLRVTDNGPGLASVDHLFEPFQHGAESTGLGLYLSRALLRSFGGDLRYAPTASGCSFVIELAVVAAQWEDAPNASDIMEHDTHPIAAG